MNVILSTWDIPDDTGAEILTRNGINVFSLEEARSLVDSEIELFKSNEDNFPDETFEEAGWSADGRHNYITRSDGATWEWEIVEIRG